MKARPSNTVMALVIGATAVPTIAMAQDCGDRRWQGDRDGA